MECKINSGIPQGCRGAGGTLRFLIANFDDVASITEADGEITAINMDSGTTFFEFKTTKHSSDFVENYKVSAGSVGFEQVVTMEFSKMEATKRNQVLLMAQANLIIIVQDKNEKYWYLGAQEGCQLSNGHAGTGKNLGDELNGYSLELTASERYPAYEVNKSVIDGLLTP